MSESQPVTGPILLKKAMPADAGYKRLLGYPWRGRAKELASYPLNFLLLLVLWVSFVQGSEPPNAEADNSWRQSYGYFLKHNFQAGRDYIFTYGPLGCFYGGGVYDGDLFWADYVWQLVVSFVMAMIVLAMVSSVPGIARKVILCASLPCVIFSFRVLDGFYVLCIFLLVAGLTLKTTCPPRYLVPALLFLAVLSLIKFTLFLFALCSVLFLAAHLLANRRGIYALGPLACFGAFFVILWMGFGQSLGSLAAYIRGSLEVAGGYSQAMSLYGGAGPTLAAASILALGAALLPLSPADWAQTALSAKVLQLYSQAEQLFGQLAEPLFVWPPA